MLPRVIGISGHKFSGKSKLANFLSNKYGYEIRSFASPLKLAVKEIFLLSDEQLYNPDKKEIIDERYGVSPREIFQKVGTDIFRNNIKNFLPNLQLPYNSIWVSNMYSYINQNPDKLIIIDDVRFEDEYLLIKDFNGTVIKIIREENNFNNLNNHESEYGCSYDYKIYNNSTLEDLYQNIDKIINEINNKNM